jgi:hypothetical protein
LFHPRVKEKAQAGRPREEKEEKAAMVARAMARAMAEVETRARAREAKEARDMETGATAAEKEDGNRGLQVSRSRISMASAITVSKMAIGNGIARCSTKRWPPGGPLRLRAVQGQVLQLLAARWK